MESSDSRVKGSLPDYRAPSGDYKCIEPGPDDRMHHDFYEPYLSDRTASRWNYEVNVRNSPRCGNLSLLFEIRFNQFEIIPRDRKKTVFVTEEFSCQRLYHGGSHKDITRLLFNERWTWLWDHSNWGCVSSSFVMRFCAQNLTTDLTPGFGFAMSDRCLLVYQSLEFRICTIKSEALLVRQSSNRHFNLSEWDQSNGCFHTAEMCE